MKLIFNSPGPAFFLILGKFPDFPDITRPYPDNEEEDFEEDD